ncbi:roadblock/LC7 domain-containing protein [Actinocorallia sp. B10E7]|uniref:roadblock/LC7 domain-containing protein n=1 Tax=Actinocorallia sp. B10E7 TaxID=3153558 RepID=UPI00325DC08F
MTQDDEWMLAEVTGVPNVRHAMVLSSDGLVKVTSAGLHRDEADRLAAACSGLHSLGRSLAGQYGSGTGNVRQVVVEIDGGFVFLRAAGQGSQLAVVTTAGVDPALISQQMAVQVRKIGESTLATPARGDLGR